MKGALDSPPVTVAGAGLAGSLMALYLARRGLTVRVLERNRDLRRVQTPAGRSINLALAERGIHALRKAGVFEHVRELLIPMRGRMLHEKSGELQLQPYSRHPEEVIYSVSRAGLTAVLMDAAERTGRVEIRFGQPVAGRDPDSGKVLLGNAGGKRHSLPARVLIAADGAGSPIRRSLQRAGHLSAQEDLLAHRYKELTIPPAEDGGFRMDPNALHVWPRGGFMLIALPNPDCSFTATLFMAERGEPGFAKLDSPESVAGFFAREFPDAVPLMPSLQTDFTNNPLGVLGTVRCQPWHKDGNALLIGDAAHAIVPFHGQGMNCAFEDCAVLDGLIEQHGEDWGRIFERFSMLRKPDADAIADMALENYTEMRDTVRDPKFHLRKALAWELEKRLPERFIPRYSMVMFRRLPYAQAFARGAIQADLLEQATGGAETLDEVDMERAMRMACERLPPIDASALVG